MEDWWKKKIIRANKQRKRERLEEELRRVEDEIAILDKEIMDAGK